MSYTRRDLITLMGAMGLTHTYAAFGLGPSSLFDVTELQLEEGTLSRPSAWKRALYELVSATSVESSLSVFQVNPMDVAIFQRPFAVLMGSGPLPKLNDESILNLQRFIQSGGFIFVDDTTGATEGAFYDSFRRLVQRIFPTRPLAPLGDDHSIFRSYFLLDRPLGRTAARNYLEGVTIGHTTPIVYCHNDLSGALERSQTGQNRYPVVPGGETQRRESIKLAINLILYSLTSNYKHDVAHVAELIREGRL